MKKLSKIIALMLAMITAISAFSLSGYAVATPLEAGSSMETAVEIPEFGVDYVSTLSVAEEVDWFKFTTLEDDAYYSVELVNYSLYGYDSGGQINSEYAPNIYLYDSNMQVINSGNNKIILNNKLENNTTYYFKVYMGWRRSSDTGNYEVSVNYIYDSVPNEMENATSISLNNTHINSLDGTGDIDWFKFSTNSPGEYVVTLKNYELYGYDSGGQINSEYAPNIYVYDAFSQQLANKNNNVTFNLELEENTTYYIKILMGWRRNSSVGKYSITVAGGDVVEPDVPSIPDTPVETVLLSSISVVSIPTKTTYTIGDTLDTTGLKIKAEYSDGTSKIISTRFIVNCAAFTKKGTYAVTVSYTEDGVTKTCTFNVNVKDTLKTLDSISVYSTPDKTTYETGETLDTSGLVVKAHYSDGTSKTVTNYTLGSFDSSTAGTKTILVSYTENGVTETATFTVEVEEEEEEPVSTGGFFESVLMAILGFFIMIIDAITSIFNMI